MVTLLQYVQKMHGMNNLKYMFLFGYLPSGHAVYGTVILISTNGLLCISSDFDKQLYMASLYVISFIDFCVFKAKVTKDLYIYIFLFYA